jgi:pimeloyl-ACP methyl ester carboxylesterase
MAFHGTPGSRFQYLSQMDVAARKGVRLIAPDRPGYGHSAYDPARTYESWASDVGQLADHIEVDHFAVLGASGGGSNAAGCARYLGDRLVGCAIVSGNAPPEANVSQDALLRTNRMLMRLAPMTPRLTSVMLGAGLRRVQRAPDKGLEWMTRSLPDCDARVLGRPDVRRAVLDDLARPLSPTAGKAAVQDIRLELRPWGFRLRDIAVPVHIWHGDLDRNVVVENGIYQANEIPHATLHRIPDEGHWLVYDHFGEILDSLAA